MAKRDEKKTEGQASVTAVEEMTNRWKRALADYQNLEKRYAREKADFVAYAGSNLILKLLAVLDHLQRVKEYLKDEGLEIAVKEFVRVLEEEGLQEIETLGRDFDPVTMEAVEMVRSKDDGKVVEELSRGYLLKEKVIRVAKVKVGRK